MLLDESNSGFFFTARIRRMGEGNIFSLFTSRRGHSADSARGGGSVSWLSRGGGGGSAKIGQQNEYSLHGGQYASCVHAGGLSCFHLYLCFCVYFFQFLALEKQLMFWFGYFLNFRRQKSFFVDSMVSGTLTWTSSGIWLKFQNQGSSLACMHAMISLDSLRWLTSSWSALQPGLFDPCFFFNHCWGLKPMPMWAVLCAL